MTSPRLCACPEPPATVDDFSRPGIEPVTAHVHEGCAVYHRGARCTIQSDLFRRPNASE